MSVITALLLLTALSLPHETLFNDGWKFAFGDASCPERDFGRGTEYFNYFTKAASIHNAGPYSMGFDDSFWEPVRIPHDWVVDLPYSAEASHSHGYKTVGWKYPQTSVGWYRKTFFVPAEWEGLRVSVRFDGIFRNSDVWVDGFWCGGEESGYASAEYCISEYLDYGAENVIAVRADATFEEGWFYEGAGIYRDVWLKVEDQSVPAAEKPAMRMPVITTDPDRGILIDGEPIRIHGANVHQDHAGVGAAIPPALYVWRIKQLKKFGFNAIRTSHNPASPALLDICDSLGMYVLEETRLMGVNEAQLEPLRKMIERDRHHPCIIMWGVGNEEWGIEWNGKGEKIARTMTGFCHGIDPTRPVVVATSGGPEIVKGADIAGYNYILQNPVEKHRAEFPLRVAVGTEETTGCGTRGVYFNDPSGGTMPAINRGPQGPDSLLNCIERGLQFYAERPYLAGMFYWTGFDYRGESNPLVFPATISQFGILDYCGFPKDEAWFVKSWWTDEPVLHILPHWNLEGHEGERVQIWVYSNCEDVALWVNGRNLGRKKMPRGGHLEWEAVYRPGTVRAVGYSGGRKVMEETVHTAGAPVRLSVVPDRTAIKADGRDLSVLEVSLSDDRGHFTPTACIPVTLTVEGPARIIGAGNGNPAYHGPERPGDPEARQFTMPSFNGLCQFLVQGSGVPGTATIKITAPGTSPETVTLKFD